MKSCTGVVRELLDSRANRISSDEKASVSQSVTDEDSGLIHQTIYHALLDQSSLAAKGRRVPDMQELVDESILFLSAGTDTSSFTLTVAVYHILSNPDVLQKLQQELEELKELCGDQAPSLKAIEKLPYLVSRKPRTLCLQLWRERFANTIEQTQKGVVKESIRLSHGVPGRLPRVVPSTGTHVGNVYLPPGTVVTMCNYYLNLNADIYPEPSKFLPERWLVNPPPEKWFVPFSKGSRSCIGVKLVFTTSLIFPYTFRRKYTNDRRRISLVYAEISMTLAALFTKFDLKLYQTGAKEMEWRDCGLPLTNGHLRVIATPRE